MSIRRNPSKNFRSKMVKETLEEKAQNIVSKLKSNINELGGMSPDAQDTEHPFYNLNASKMSKKEMNALMKKHYGKENYFDDEEETNDWEEIDIKGMDDMDDEDFEMEDDIDYEEEQESELDEGFDSFEMKNFRKREDYNPKEFRDLPLGKDEIGFDEEQLDDNTGVDMRRKFFNDIRRSFKRKKDFDDEYGDEEFAEGKDETCEQCGGGTMKEGECVECGYKMEGIYDVDDIDNEENEFDYVEEEMNEDIEDSQSESDIVRKKCEEHGEDSEACKKHKEYAGMGGELEEKLHGKQRKLDKNKNGRIDAADFKMLRAMKENSNRRKRILEDDKSSSEEVGLKLENEIIKTIDNEISSGNPLSNVKAEAITKYFEHKLKSLNTLSEDSIKKMKENLNNKLKSKVSAEEVTEDEEEMEEGNAFTGALAKAKKEGKDKFEVGGKKFDVTEGKTKGCKICGMKNCKCNHKKNTKGRTSVKESVKLTESQLIELIEGIILEQKEKLKNVGGQPRGLQKYKQAHEKSGKENKEYLNSVGKKMKEYTKDGSKGGFDMNPKKFPMGNGELGEMKKKAYKISDAGKDFLNSYQRPGMENLDYDEIHPNEDWMKDNIEGSSRTGNNPKWANAVETDVNKNINKKRKENKYAKAKRAAFQKSPQPVINDKTGDEDGTGIHINMESTNPKNVKKLNEEFDKIKNLMDYNRKTQ